MQPEHDNGFDIEIASLQSQDIILANLEHEEAGWHAHPRDRLACRIQDGPFDPVGSP
jgi:hypothetical protein